VAKAVSNISLMTEFVKENYLVICGSAYNRKLVAVLINCQEVSMNCPHLKTAEQRLINLKASMIHIRFKLL
jgi:hypothetical protein